MCEREREREGHKHTQSQRLTERQTETETDRKTDRREGGKGRGDREDKGWRECEGLQEGLLKGSLENVRMNIDLV